MAENTREERKEAILKAALEAYGRYGIAEATVQKIAEIAGIGKSTVFEYFRSSGELMDEAFGYLIGQTATQWQTLRPMAVANPAWALNGYFDNLTKLILRQPQKLLLVSQYATAILAGGRDFGAVKEDYRKKLQPSADALMEQFRFIAAHGIQSGAFHPIGGADQDDCALFLSAIAREMQAQAFVQDEEEIRKTCRRLKGMAMAFLGVREGGV